MSIGEGVEEEQLSLQEQLDGVEEHVIDSGLPEEVEEEVEDKKQ